MAYRKLIFAHRGLSDEYAENTMPAFKAAADAGFDGIELDIRATHDDVVVCHHDAGIDRTTDGNGRLGDYTWEELQEYQTEDGPIPALEEVCKLPICLNVEIKDARAGKLAVSVLRGRDHTMISAMDPSSLQHFQKHAPEIPRALITLGPPDVDDLEMAAELACSFINVDYDFLTAEVARMIRDRGFQVGAWTVNDEVDALALDADHIITDTRAVKNALQARA